MTEQEWRECTEPHKMLAFLHECGASERKLRLFAVACSRRIWEWIDPLGRAAVETAERYADGLCSPYALRAARLACQGAGEQASWYAAATNPAVAARNAARSAQIGVANNSVFGTEAAELLAQANLVREIFGNPFRSLPASPVWRLQGVTNLAQRIYDDRTFDRMMALAEALGEAGCYDQETLSHCRVAGPHVRGCWMVDRILAKK